MTKSSAAPVLPCANQLVRGGPLPPDVTQSLTPAEPDDPFNFEYTLNGPKNTGTFRFVGRIVKEVEVEMWSRATRERFMGVRLVLENRDGHQITTVGMRKRDVRAAKLAGSPS